MWKEFNFSKYSIYSICSIFNANDRTSRSRTGWILIFSSWLPDLRIFFIKPSPDACFSNSDGDLYNVRQVVKIHFSIRLDVFCQTLCLSVWLCLFLAPVIICPTTLSKLTQQSIFRFFQNGLQVHANGPKRVKKWLKMVVLENVYYEEKVLAVSKRCYV